MPAHSLFGLFLFHCLKKYLGTSNSYCREANWRQKEWSSTKGPCWFEIWILNVYVPVHLDSSWERIVGSTVVEKGPGQVTTPSAPTPAIHTQARSSASPFPSHLVPTEPHRRVWKAASLVLSTLVSLTNEADTCTGVDSYNSDLALSSNQMSLLKYPKLSQCLFGMEMVHFPSRKKSFFGKLTSRVNPLDYCNQVFL